MSRNFGTFRAASNSLKTDSRDNWTSFRNVIDGPNRVRLALSASVFLVIVTMVVMYGIRTLQLQP